MRKIIQISLDKITSTSVLKDLLLIDLNYQLEGLIEAAEETF